jgi:hypothetical protein
VCLIRIRSRRSLHFLVGLLVPVNIRETLLEVVIGACLREEGLSLLVERKSAPKFFRVFAMSTKLTNLGGLEEEGVVEC